MLHYTQIMHKLYVAYGLHFLVFRLDASTDAPYLSLVWCWHGVTILWRVVSSCLMSWHYGVTSFMTSFGMCVGPIIGLATTSWGGFLVHLLRGKEVHVHVLVHPFWESLLPPNLTNWVVITSPCVPASADVLIHSKNGLGTPCSSLWVLSPQDCHAFRLVPMSTVPDVEGLHHRKHTAAGVAHYRSCAAFITIIGIPGWAPAENDMSGLICGLHSISVATRVIKCCYGKKGEQRYALIPGGLASWIEMVWWTWQATDLMLIQWC